MQTEKTRWRLPDQYNYVGVFLTLQCNYRCSDCINGAQTRLKHRAHRTWAEWAEFLEALDTRDIPLTLQGGEPTQYPGFYSWSSGWGRRARSTC
jgi:organic radical activating enzyme